jgi:hypothetical protein
MSDTFSYEDAAKPAQPIKDAAKPFSYEEATGETTARGLKGWGRDIAATAVKGAIAVPEALVRYFGPEALFGIVIIFVLVFGSISEMLGFHFVIGAFFGARTAISGGSKFIRPVFITVVLALTVRLAWQHWFGQS